MTTDKEVRELAQRAVRLSIDGTKLYPMTKHEKSITDDMDFLYWLVRLAKLDENEACAKVCEDNFSDGALNIAEAIRARRSA